MDNQSSRDNHLPVYNIKAVSRILGLLPVTLRAWERRYGLPTPHRGSQGYRLYSEYDLKTLRWLKNQMDTGMSIGRAVDYLSDLRANGRDPAEENQPPALLEKPASLQVLANQLLTSLIHFNDAAATETMRRAFSLYPIDHVLIDIVQPTMVELGDAWHRGELPIGVEHFATQFCMQNLMGMLNASISPYREGAILAACAPGEMHQIGLLMLVVMLRWRGWDVKYLGPDLSLQRLEETLLPLHPALLLFTATRPESAQALLGLPDILNKLPAPQPMVVLGGQAFEKIHFPDLFTAVYLQDSPTDMVKSIEKLMIEAYHPKGYLR